MYTIGFDYSLTHGSVVMGDFSKESPIFIPIMTYDKKYEHIVKYKDDSYDKQVIQTQLLITDINRHLQKYLIESENYFLFKKDFFVAIDFTPNIVNFGKTNKLQAMATASNLRTAYHTFYTFGQTPVIVEPLEVRKTLGLKGNLSKDLTIQAYREIIPLPDTKNTDILDASILSYVLWKKLYDK